MPKKDKGAQAPTLIQPATAVKMFISKLEGLDRSRSTREKFRDFCELAYCAHAKLMAQSEEEADKLEARYMRIVNSYVDKTAFTGYAELRQLAHETVMNFGVDFLGDVAGQLSALSSEQGQFFTPTPVSEMMARMILQDVGPIIEREGFIRLDEPASGAGGMVLAAANALDHQGFNPCVQMFVHTADISQLAYYMCYLQLTWRGLAAYVERADTLRMEHFEGAWTLGTLMFQEYQDQRRAEKRTMELARAFRELLRDIETKPNTISLRPELAMLKWSAINRRWCVSQAQVIKA